MGETHTIPSMRMKDHWWDGEFKNVQCVQVDKTTLGGRGLMRIRYTERAARFLRRVRLQNENHYHNIRGLVIQLSVNPEIDNESKILRDFGSGRSTPMYVDDDWWIVYRVTRNDTEEVLEVISIWDARNPPNTRL